MWKACGGSLGAGSSKRHFEIELLSVTPPITGDWRAKGSISSLIQIDVMACVGGLIIIVSCIVASLCGLFDGVSV